MFSSSERLSLFKFYTLSYYDNIIICYPHVQNNRSVQNIDTVNYINYTKTEEA